MVSISLSRGFVYSGCSQSLYNENMSSLCSPHVSFVLLAPIRVGCLTTGS